MEKNVMGKIGMKKTEYIAPKIKVLELREEELMLNDSPADNSWPVDGSRVDSDGSKIPTSKHGLGDNILGGNNLFDDEEE